MGVVRVKPGVEFSIIGPGGFVLLAAIEGAAAALPHDVTISSGSDGCHSGIHDPHKEGNAYDVRTHDIPDKDALLREIESRLPPGRFYVFIEAENSANEHIHGQVKRGTTYP